MSVPDNEADTERLSPPAIRSAMLKRSVRCGRCSEPLYYPSTLSRRTAVLCCAHCGAQTAIPSGAARALKIACVFFYVAAVVLILAFARQHL